MRKVLSFVLVLALVLSSFSMAFAADVEVPSVVLTDIAGEDYEQAAQTLIDLGVVTGYEDKTFGGDRDVTRAEMAAMVCKALGLNGGGSNSFPDARNHWAAEWIGLAQSLSIITGYADGTFKPDANVTYHEALAMLIKALGYNDNSLPGTWPNKYIAQASKLGISDGVSISGSNANRGDIATMLYQTLDQQTGKTNKDGLWIGDTRDSGAVKVTMYLLLGMEYVQDVTIERSLASKINLLPFLGAKADVYRDKDKRIVAIYEVKTAFLTGEYNATRNVFEADEDYSIAASGVANATIGGFYFVNADVKTTYNNLTSFTGGPENDTCTIAVELSGKRITKVVSILYWDLNKAVYDRLEESDLTALNASSPSLLGFKFPLNDNNELNTNGFYLLGVSSLEDVQADNIAVGYYDDNRRIVKLEVGTETASGEITRLSNDLEATIDGVVYEESSAAPSSPVSNVEVGNEVKLFLDYHGCYFDADLISGGTDQVGLVLATKNGSGSGSGTFGTVAKVELFLPDGTAKVFEISNNAKFINSANVSTPASLTDLSADGITAGAVLRYALNKSGVITSFSEFGNGAAGNSDTRDITAKGTYAGREINKNAVLFVVDNAYYGVSGTPLDSDEVSITTLDKILDTENVPAYYFTDKNARIAAMIIDENIIGADEVYGVVIDWGKASSDTNYYTMLVDGESVTYYTDNTPAENRDTLYEVDFNAVGNVTLNSVTTAAIKAFFSLSGAAVHPVGIEVTNGEIVGKWNGNSFVVVDLTTTASITMAGIDVVGAKVTCDVDVVVYYKDKVSTPSGEKYKIGTKADATNARALGFFDVDGDDITDIILVLK